MAIVTLVEAQPWDPVTGAVVPVRLAGGGRRHYRHKGFADWRAGVVSPPRLAEALEFDGSFTGGAIPSSSAIGFMPARAATRAQIARLMWVGAPIVVSTGDDDAAVPAWTVELAGAVAGYSVQGGSFTFTIANLAGRLDKPLVTATFAGTGGIEGAASAAGRLKRRSWGRCWNIEGRLLDAATNIYEFGDPAHPIAGFDQVKDKGRFGPLAIVAWAGSIDATLAALKVAQAPAGGAAVAPSIACAKWYTQPVAITADLRGEVAGSYSETVAGIAAAISAAAGGPPVIDLAAAIAARPEPAGLHVEDAGERGVAALDRLLLRATMGWSLLASGGLAIAPLAFADPIATIVGGVAEREAAFAPVAAVQVGWRRNHRVMAAGDISAAVTAGEVTFDDGSTAEELKPAMPGATAGAPAGTTVGGVIQPDGSIKGGLLATEVVAALAGIEPITLDVSALKEAKVGTDAALAALDDAIVDQAAVQRQIERDAGRLDEVLLRTLAEANRTRTVLRDAGIVVDPVTGIVRIYAVDQLADRTSRAEVTLDAQKAQITSKASVDQVQELIAAAVLDPSQIAELEPLILRLSSAEIEIDGLDAAVRTKAELIELTRLGGRVTTAEQAIDAAEGLIAAKVEQTDFDLAMVRLGTAEQSLRSYGDISSFSVTLRQARAATDAGADATLRAILGADAADRRRIVAQSEVRQELYAKITDDVAAEARSRLVLAVAVGALDARSVQDRVALVDADKALARDIDALAVASGDQAAAIATLQEATIGADGGFAGIRTTIRQIASRADTSDEALLRSLIAGDVAGQARRDQLVQIQTELSTQLVANEIASAVARQTLLVRMLGNEAAIVDVARVAAEADRVTAERLAALEVAFGDDVTGLKATSAALAAEVKLSAERDEARGEEIELLTATINDPATGLAQAHAAIGEANTAIADLDEATARSLEQVGASVGKVSGRVDDLREVVVGPDGVETRAVVRLDAKGRVSGTVQTNDGAVASFGVVADRFGVYHPDTGALLFYVDTDGAIAASFKKSSIGFDELAMGSAQKCAFFTLANDVAVGRNQTVQIVSVTFTKEDADSTLEVMFNGDFSSPDDLQFTGVIAIDGAAVKSTRTNIILVDANAAMPITPFAYATGIPAGQRTVTFAVTNNESDNATLTIHAGSTIKVNELRKASIGSITGSGAVPLPSGGGGGGYGGGGGGGGGSNPPVQQN